MSRVSLPLSQPRRMGETQRRDAWWIQPLIVFTILTSFLVYATWAAFQNAHYTYGPYLSPFYSPELWGSSPHAWFGPQPNWWPAWLPFSPALIILPFPAFFRFTCYYYRGAYYKAFWSDPPSCAVGEWRSTYIGEKSSAFDPAEHPPVLPLLCDPVHLSCWPTMPCWRSGSPRLMARAKSSASVWVPSSSASTSCCWLVTRFGCHSFRHLVGGVHDLLSKHPIKKKVYDCSSCLNRYHMNYAWMSLFSVAFSDIYIRLCSMGIWSDFRIL
jgi:hypothetical protein